MGTSSATHTSHLAQYFKRYRTSYRGVPMMVVILRNDGGTSQSVAYWAKVRDGAWDEVARFSEAEIARIKVFMTMG